MCMSSLCFHAVRTLKVVRLVRQVLLSQDTSLRLFYWPKSVCATFPSHVALISKTLWPDQLSLLHVSTAVLRLTRYWLFQKSWHCTSSKCHNRSHSNNNNSRVMRKVTTTYTLQIHLIMEKQQNVITNCTWCAHGTCNYKHGVIINFRSFPLNCLPIDYSYSHHLKLVHACTPHCCLNHLYPHTVKTEFEVCMLSTLICPNTHTESALVCIGTNECA